MQNIQGRGDAPLKAHGFPLFHSPTELLLARSTGVPSQ